MARIEEALDGRFYVFYRGLLVLVVETHYKALLASAILNAGGRA